MLPATNYYNTINEIEIFLQKLTITMLGIVIVFLLIALAQYIMQSIALTHIGRRRGIKAPWLIWIPIARNWAIGALADEYDARNGLRRRFRVILLVLILVYFVAYIALYAALFSIVPALENAGSNINLILPMVMKLFIGAYCGIIVIVLMAFAYSALYYVCLYKIFESLSSKHCVLFFILSMFIPLFMPICLLCLRNGGHPYPEMPAELPEDCEKGWYEA